MKARNNIREISRDRSYTVKSRQEKQAQRQSEVKKNRTATSAERPSRLSPQHVHSPYRGSDMPSEEKVWRELSRRD